MQRKLLLATNLCNGALACDCPLFSPFAETAIENTLKIVKAFDEIYIVNDKHTASDTEMRYMPPHNIVGGIGHTVPPYIKDGLEGFRATFLQKRIFNAIGDTHNKMVIFNSGINDIYLAGGQLSTDVFFTAAALLEAAKNVWVVTDCCFDVSREVTKMVLDHMGIINIRFVKSAEIA